MEIAKHRRIDAGIYVIDDNYQIVYANQEAKHIFPTLKVGGFCYKTIANIDMPCECCPFQQQSQENNIIYNRFHQQWREVFCGEIDWPETGRCRFVAARNIEEGKQNLFLNLTRIEAYDELYELNLTANTYKILFHKKNKYIIPALEGTLTTMLQDAAEHMVHPEDRDLYREFWDLNQTPEKIKIKDSNKIAMGQFRKKLLTGDYCWASQVAVPLKNEGSREQIVMCFIQDINQQMQEELSITGSASMEAAEKKDSLTGLYKKSSFFVKAQELLKSHADEKYCVMAIDIEHFKLFNEWYGQDEGDKFLISIGAHLSHAQDTLECVAGYMGGDDFVILLPDDDNVIEPIQKEIMEYVKQYGGNAGFLPAFGVYEVKDIQAPVSIMYDRAMIAMASIKGNYTVRTARYDDTMKQKMEGEQVLLSEVQRALEKNEFVFYAQPKCNMITGKIVGLESLIRWNHPTRGMVPPSEFIPVLEKNGFITNLDLWLWEDVCKKVRHWIDKGNRPIPISVNVSRIDIYAVDVVEVFNGLIEKYSLDPELIEIEITESAYAEDYQVISKVVNDLREAGFTVLMDDFGSGYSSLNMLKDVNVDILKIDIKFLDLNKESLGRGVGILEAIVKMGKLMNLRLIAEGIETREQADFLLNMGCLYGQGYYFYRPMPLEIFEPLLLNESNIDYRGLHANRIETLRLNDLFSGNAASETMLNNMMGGIAFYDIHDGVLELVRVNEQYYKVTGGNPIDLEERRQEVIKLIHKEDREKILDIFYSAKENLFNGSEGEIRRLNQDGTLRWMHMHIFFLKEQDGHDLFYGVVTDITDQKRQERELEASQKELKAVLGISNQSLSFMNLAKENRAVAGSIFAQMSPGGMIGGYCEEGFPLYFVNDEMIKLLGYESYEELSEAIDGKVVNTIHPDDMPQVMKDIGPEYYVGLEYTTKYRMPKKDGTWFWTLDRGKVLRAEDGRLAIVSACMDITENMIIQQELLEANELLRQQNKELTFLDNQMPGGYHYCAVTPDLDLTYMSPRFLEALGYSREEIREEFQDKLIHMIHPDDRLTICDMLLRQSEDNPITMLNFRIRSKQGYLWVSNQVRKVEQEGREFLYCAFTEIKTSPSS